MDHETVLGQYETWMRSWGASERTIKARVKLARSRLNAWGMSGMTANNLGAYLGRDGLSKWTRATYHANLKDFCAWAEAAGYLDESPFGDLRKPKRPTNIPHPLSEDEVARVLAVAVGHTRDWLLLALLAGMRAHEIAKIRGEDVSTDSLYVRGKGDRDASLPLHPDLWVMAQRYPRSGYWFPGHNGHPHVLADTITRGVSELFRRCGIRDGSIHRARHVYGTRLLRSGAHIRTVQRLMRHATLETTAAYTAVYEDEMRAAITSLPSSG